MESLVTPAPAFLQLPDLYRPVDTLLISVHELPSQVSTLAVLASVGTAAPVAIIADV